MFTGEAVIVALNVGVATGEFEGNDSINVCAGEGVKGNAGADGYSG